MYRQSGHLDYQLLRVACSWKSCEHTITAGSGQSAEIRAKKPPNDVPFVLILAKSGTSLVVRVALSRVFTIALKHSRVWTLIDRILVLVNRICIVSYVAVKTAVNLRRH